MSLPMPKFDPMNPLPRHTLYNVLQTGPGQASRRWLWRGLWLGFSLSLLLLLVKAQWLAAFTVAASSFAIYGLAEKSRQALDIQRQAAPGTRRILRVVQIIAIALGAGGVLLGVLYLIGIILTSGTLA